MTDALLYLAGVLLFTIGVAASIGLHELGHLVPGKLFDVKITQYFVGFGRTIWSRRRGETEYGVKAIPLGGYVKLVGMLPPAPHQDPAKVRAGQTGIFAQLVSDARSAEYEHVAPEDHDRLFYRLPWWKRVVIMGSGVTINLVIAFGLFAVVFMGYGIQEPTTTVGSVAKCVKVVQAGQDAGPCTSSDPATPALLAGLRPGDRIERFNGTRLTSYDQLQRLIRANESGAATLVVDRGGETLTLTTSTTVTTTPTASARIPTYITHDGGAHWLIATGPWRRAAGPRSRWRRSACPGASASGRWAAGVPARGRRRRSRRRCRRRRRPAG